MFKIISKKNFSLHKRKFSFAGIKNNSKLNAKSFEDIPGPSGPLGLGNIFNYLPGIGKYSWLKIHEASLDKYIKYGSIVKEKMVPGNFVIWLYDPNDIAVVLNEKDYPQRRSHLALEKFRKDRPHVYKSAGLLPTNGAEWWRIRSEFQKELSIPKNVRTFLPDIDNVTKEFIMNLKSDEIIDILPELARLNLELTCLLTFGVRLGSFSSSEYNLNSRTSKLIKSAEDTNSSILPTDQGFQFWRYFETPTYRKLRKAQEYMESVAVELVSQKLSFYSDESDNFKVNGVKTRVSLLDQYLKNPNIDLSDIVGMTADMLLAGIDTTSYSTSFALYHLAKNPESQNKLLDESRTILKNPCDAISEEILKSKIPYARAVLKEVFRLNPISVGVGRILNSNCVLGGYNVPRDTVVVTQNMVASRLEKYFENAAKFSPERWMNRAVINPYLVLPFGHGMRACIARRLAEQNMLVFLLRIVRLYEIKWMGKDFMDVETLLINKPDQPVKIVLIPR
ncbi:cytochrome P450 302a1, mitochondrial [Condylostylus longicornis]|uniref:cytochrome P450 302a1, mitochondrial n=1 Tax=Condylostylus longicornis TaxID=2530218 RepID=UPI00244E2E94|nr:cytochrome P450 302a1, mitochondrial [Condylostylus longicornis]